MAHPRHIHTPRPRATPGPQRLVASSDGARLAELSPGLQGARRKMALCVCVGVLSTAPWEGWVPAISFAVLAGPLMFMNRRMDRTGHPERMALGVQLLILILVLVGITATGGVASPYLPWIALPVMVAAARFRTRAFAACAVVAGSNTAVVLLASSAHALTTNPSPAIVLVVLLAAVVILQQPVRDVEERLREDVVLDALTGLFNRHGLERRFEEIAVQARRLNAPVSVILFDIDHFKAVNDTHGHAAGDDVLVAVTEILRGSLRSFELLYRLGGDELLLLLPSASSNDAARIAEDARRSVQNGHPAGFEVTVSLGFCTAYGEQIGLDEMYASADRALYSAKRNGRNTVGGLGARPVPPPSSPGDATESVSRTTLSTELDPILCRSVGSRSPTRE
jgi:diguanylate cyclase (GGDEF)-like protein